VVFNIFFTTDIKHCPVSYGICQQLEAGRWFSPGTPVTSINKTDRHDNWNIVEGGIKHHTTKPPTCFIWEIYVPLNSNICSENM